MSKVVSVFKTLRNHWKKSTFGFLVISYGVNYGYEKHRVNKLIASYCEESKLYGDAPLPIGIPARQITVILNPAANGGNAKADFEKYCAPLLYLAGIKVSVVKTESVGEARGLVDVMDNTNGIVVAGGDGALSEVVTGLLRRNDSDLAAKTYPIGIIPVGRVNSVAQALFKDYRSDRVQMMAEATMAVVRDLQRSIDVMKVEILESETEKPAGKPVYAVGEIKWGAFRDVEERFSKYWIWGPMKQYAAYFFGAFHDLTWNCEALLRYTIPCDGCQRCKVEEAQALSASNAPTKSRWWHMFLPRAKPATDVQPTKDYSKIINPNCGLWQEKQVSTVEFRTMTENNINYTKTNEPRHLEISIGPKNMSAIDFIREGFSRVSGTSELKRGRISARQLELLPANLQAEGASAAPPEQEAGAAASEGESKEATATEKKVDAEKWYSIDNDNYEVKPIRVTLLPQLIRVFASPTRAVKLEHF